MDQLVTYWGVMQVPMSIGALAALLMMKRSMRRTIYRDHELGQVKELVASPPEYSFLTTTRLLTLYDVPRASVMPAWLLDLAVRGYIRLYQRVELTNEPRPVYEIEVRRPLDDLYPEEREVLAGMFGRDVPPPGERLPVSFLRYNGGYNKHFLTDQAKLEVVMRGQYGLTERRPEHWRLFTRYMVVFGVLGVLTLSIPLAVAAAQAWYDRRRYSLSNKGLALRRQLSGVRRAVESPRDAMALILADITAPDDTEAVEQALAASERLLPYAVLFDQTPAWANMLSNCYLQLRRPPAWFSKNANFSAQDFQAVMADFPYTTWCYMTNHWSIWQPRKRR